MWNNFPAEIVKYLIPFDVKWNSPFTFAKQIFHSETISLGEAKFHSPKANFVEKAHLRCRCAFFWRVLTEKMPSYFLLFFCFITTIKSKMHAVITSSKLQTLKANGSSMHKSKRPMIQLKNKHKDAASGIMLTFFIFLPPFCHLTFTFLRMLFFVMGTIPD